MSEPIWILRSVVDAIHDMQLAEHRGAAGVRDDGLIESALARPRNLYAHGASDLCALGASYAFGIVRNHPFVDGNKRTAFLTAYVFLRINGVALVADEASAAQAMLALASGTIDEGDFVAWLRQHTNLL